MDHRHGLNPALLRLPLRSYSRSRIAELEQLAWENIHLKDRLIEVPALSSKTASCRFVEIRPNLAKWLEPYRDRLGLICPPGLRKRLEADRAAAGITRFSIRSTHPVKARSRVFGYFQTALGSASQCVSFVEHPVHGCGTGLPAFPRR